MRAVGAVQRRIYGVETEYGIIFTPEGRKTLTVEKDSVAEFSNARERCKVIRQRVRNSL